MPDTPAPVPPPVPVQPGGPLYPPMPGYREQQNTAFRTRLQGRRR